MTASELASKVGGKKHGKEWLVRCPAHRDNHPSLSIGTGKKVPVVLSCLSHGCNTQDILRAWGLSWDSVFYNKPTPEIRARIRLQEVRAAFQRRLGLVCVLQAIDRPKRSYWSAAERGIVREIDELRPLLEPEKVFQEWRERMFKKRINKYGWDELWRQVK
jgi:hypothetical protein